MTSKNRYSNIALTRGIGISAFAAPMVVSFCSADATTTATALGTGVSSFMDTLTSVSLAMLTNSTLVTAMVIASIIFAVLYWIKNKFL